MCVEITVVSNLINLEFKPQKTAGDVYSLIFLPWQGKKTLKKGFTWTAKQQFPDFKQATARPEAEH